MPIRTADKKYLKNKQKGGRNNAKGKQYEDFYAVYQLALLIDKYRSNPSVVYLSSQLSDTFVDDLLIEKEDSDKTYHQLKDVNNINWSYGKLKYDFERQREISIENEEQFTLKIVYSDINSSIHQIPENISDCTTAEYFPSYPSTQLLYYGFQPFREAIKNIAIPSHSTDNELIGISGALLGAWGMVNNQLHTSLQEILENVDNIGRGFINMNIYPSADISESCSALFHQIGIDYQIHGSSLYWSYGYFNGCLPWTAAVEEKILTASPKDFKEIIDLLN